MALIRVWRAYYVGADLISKRTATVAFHLRQTTSARHILKQQWWRHETHCCLPFLHFLKRHLMFCRQTPHKWNSASHSRHTEKCYTDPSFFWSTTPASRFAASSDSRMSVCAWRKRSTKSCGDMKLSSFFLTLAYCKRGEKKQKTEAKHKDTRWSLEFNRIMTQTWIKQWAKKLLW